MRRRFDEYQRSGDPDYQTLYGLALNHEVPTQVANQVWEMRHAVQEQTDRIRDNPLLSAEQKLRALDAVRSETTAAIVDVLGEPLLRDYQRAGAGWLSELTAAVGLTEAIIPVPPVESRTARFRSPNRDRPPTGARGSHAVTAANSGAPDAASYSRTRRGGPRGKP